MGLGGRGGVTDEKGGPGKGGSGPPDPPPLWTRLCRFNGDIPVVRRTIGPKDQ